MPVIPPEIRTLIWVFAGIFSFFATILLIPLGSNIWYRVRVSLGNRSGRKPTKKPRIVWILFFIFTSLGIIGTAVASSAPEDIPLPDAIRTAIPPRNETLVVVFPTDVPTKRLTPTAIPTPAPAKIIIVLDVSKRMGDELDKPGVTKLDVARSAILQLLDTFEGSLVDIELIYITDEDTQACEVSNQYLPAIGFTQDFDLIRKTLDSLKPSKSENAPLVETLESVMKENNNPTNPVTFFIFTGGDDTCQKSVEVFYKAQKTLPQNAAAFETFLILLLGKEEPPKWANEQFGVSLGLARDAKEVQTLTATFGNQVVSELPAAVPTSMQIVLADPTKTSAVIFPTSLPQVVPTQSPTSTITPEPTFTSTLPPPTFTSSPIPTIEPPKPFALLYPPNNTAYNCDPSAGCMQSVIVQWVPQDQTGGLHLSIWVKPYPESPDYQYYVQPSPYYTSDSLWTSTEIYIGQLNDPVGTPFQIFALVTAEEYFRGQSFDNLPSFLKSAYVDVTR